MKKCKILVGDIMLSRKIDIFLDNWIHRKRKKALIIEGPGQVGKTHSVLQFAKRNYGLKNFVYVNFKEHKELSRVFNRDLTTDRLVQEIKVRFAEKELEKGDSLIFFDDIQECPSAIQDLRKFTDDGGYDVIASGNYLGPIISKMKSFPVGYIERFEMKSLDFEEYLWANNFKEERISYFRDMYLNQEFRLAASHDLLIDLFKEYMVIGGMPEVVSEYVHDRNFKKSFEIQQNIIKSYKDGITKYASTVMAKKVIECLTSVPLQLCKNNKKFQYRYVSSKGRASKYESSVKWLIESYLCFRSDNVIIPKRPLSENMRIDTFKIYLHDPGLLVSMLGEDMQLRILRGEVGVSNGAALESVIATILNANGYQLYYYEKNSTLDIDFIIPVDRVEAAIVVREADNAKSKTLSSVITKYDVDHGIKFSMTNANKKGNIETYPLYMSMFLKR